MLTKQKQLKLPKLNKLCRLLTQQSKTVYGCLRLSRQIWNFLLMTFFIDLIWLSSATNFQIGALSNNFYFGWTLALVILSFFISKSELFFELVSLTRATREKYSSNESSLVPIIFALFLGTAFFVEFVIRLESLVQLSIIPVIVVGVISLQIIYKFLNDRREYAKVIKREAIGHLASINQQNLFFIVMAMVAARASATLAAQMFLTTHDNYIFLAQYIFSVVAFYCAFPTIANFTSTCKNCARKVVRERSDIKVCDMCVKTFHAISPAVSNSNHPSANGKTCGKKLKERLPLIQALKRKFPIKNS